MLLELSVEDFALIDKLRMTPGPGLNVFTGETGAGKSMIIDALSVVLGDRALTEYVRSGAEEARVRAVFDLSQVPEARAHLIDQGIGIACDEPLIITRTIARNGRNSLRVNGELVTVSMARAATELLMDIHGQHQHQSLLNSRSHRDFLDAFAGDPVASAKQRVEELYGERMRLQAELKTLAGDTQERARQLEILQFQIEEIEIASLKVGEEESLRAERSRLANIERLQDAVSTSYQLLQEGEEPVRAILELLGEVTGQLAAAKEFAAELDEPATAVEATFYQLQEVARELRRFSESLYYDPERLLEVDDRLQLITQLGRKYGHGIEAILAYRQRMSAEVERLENNEARAQEIEGLISGVEQELAQAASDLSDLRRLAAGRFSHRVKRELAEVAMENCRFEVDFRFSGDDEGDIDIESLGRKVAVGPAGYDVIEFLISPNPGEELRPLSRTASGGELSRIMLSLKTILASVDKVPSLIFDEVDAGIGGLTAQSVARKLAYLSSVSQQSTRSSDYGPDQVICITHLPQIAAYADRHWQIEKTRAGDRTVTRIKELDQEGRVQELERMLGSGFGSDADTAKQHASEMLERAHRIKESFQKH